MSSKELSARQRVIVYIDGFNFYYGLREQRWNCYYWLDYPKLAAKLTAKLENSTLLGTKYFTARITSPESKRRRQTDFIEVLGLRGNISIYFGNYRESRYECTGCNRPNYIPNEKQTDVNIAVQLLSDAYRDSFDTAILISGDSDLVPPIKAIKDLFPNKKVIACFPPKRFSKEIRAISGGEIHIHEADLKNNQLPETVMRPDGYIYERPEKWK